MQQQTVDPNMTLRYQISFPEFMEFHLYIARDTVRKNKRRLHIMGGMEFVLGVGLIAVLFAMGKGITPIMTILAAILVAAGLSTILYAMIIFPQQLEKAAIKEYASNAYLQHEVELAFYDTYYLEGSQGGIKAVPQNQISTVEELDRIWLVLARSGKATVIPKAAVSDEMRPKLQDFFQQARHRDEDPSEKLNEKRLVI